MAKVPRIARIHYIQAENDFHAVVTGIDEETLNRVFKAVGDFADLAAAIAFILDVLAPIVGGSVVNSKAPVGDLHALATAILAAYPSGYIPAVP